MSNRDELLSQFKDITGSTDENAAFFLDSSNWALEDAISSFYENNGDAANLGQPSASVPSDENMESADKAKEHAQRQGAAGAGFNKSVKPKIATLNSMTKESSDEEEGQAFYAGGSERSGQQVLGSPKRKNFRDELTNMFKMAQEHGAFAEAPPSTSGSERNWGVGLRLGQTDDEQKAPREQQKSVTGRNIETVVLKLWRQGFTINDGELRQYDNPENKMFLETVMRGEIPEEMQRMGSQVGVDVEDHRLEYYACLSTKVPTFNGSGHTLGSVVPNVQEDRTPEQKPIDSTVSKEEHEEKAAQNLNLNQNEPTTTLQIRLADGTRFRGEFNLNHTINDIRQYITNARPQYANQNFMLVTSFPTRELSDGSCTIETAKLQNAVLMQRLK